MCRGGCICVCARRLVVVVGGRASMATACNSSPYSLALSPPLSCCGIAKGGRVPQCLTVSLSQYIIRVSGIQCTLNLWLMIQTHRVTIQINTDELSTSSCSTRTQVYVIFINLDIYCFFPRISNRFYRFYTYDSDSLTLASGLQRHIAADRDNGQLFMKWRNQGSKWKNWERN